MIEGSKKVKRRLLVMVGIRGNYYTFNRSNRMEVGFPQSPHKLIVEVPGMCSQNSTIVRTFDALPRHRKTWPSPKFCINLKIYHVSSLFSMTHFPMTDSTWCPEADNSRGLVLQGHQDSLCHSSLRLSTLQWFYNQFTFFNLCFFGSGRMTFPSCSGKCS